LTNKELYIEFETQNNFPFFSRSAWLDVVAEDWQVALFTTKNKLTFFFAYVLEKKGPFTFVRNPYFTPYSQFIFQEDKAIEADYSEMILFLEKFKQNFSFVELDFPEKAFYAKSVAHKVMRTNKISLNHKNENFALELANSNTQKQIIKGRRLEISNTKEAAIVFQILKKTFERQDKKYAFSLDLISNIIAFIYTNNCGKVWLATDSAGQHHSALIQVWDQENSYYLTGGSNYKFKNSGGMAALQAHAIGYANTLHEDVNNGLKKPLSYYDFEGSQVEGINNFFKSFGGSEFSYCRVVSENNVLLKIIKKAKNIFKK
jgi:hypothetical protein